MPNTSFAKPCSHVTPLLLFPNEYSGEGLRFPYDECKLAEGDHVSAQQGSANKAFSIIILGIHTIKNRDLKLKIKVNGAGAGYRITQT